MPSDDTTQFLGKPIPKGTKKIILLYIFIDIFISTGTGLGQTLFELNQQEWQSKWNVNKAGWILIQISGVLGSALLTIKTATSNSTKQ